MLGQRFCMHEIKSNPAWHFLLCRPFGGIVDNMSMNVPVRFAESELSKVCVVLATRIFA